MTTLHLAERAILAAALRDNDTLAAVRQGVSPRDLTDPAHRRIYAAMCQLADSGERWDAIVVADALGDDGPQIVADLAAEDPLRSMLDAHIRIVADAARRRRQLELAEELRDAVASGAQIDGILAALQEEGAGAADTPAFATLAALLESPDILTPPPAVVPYLAIRGRATILSAAPKSGKTTLAAAAAAAVTTGGRWLGAPTHTETGAVLWVGLEEAVPDAVRRFADSGADPARLYILTASRRDLLDELRRMAREHRPDLVVVDSLREYARVTTGEVPADGDSAGWAAIVRPLTALAHSISGALLTLHHARRSDGAYSGAPEIAAAADMVIEMRVPAACTDPTERHYVTAGRWTCEPFRTAMRGGQYVLAEHAGALSLDARVLAHIAAHPGSSQRAILAAVNGRTMEVGAALRTLESRGAITNGGTASRAQWTATGRGY